MTRRILLIFGLFASLILGAGLMLPSAAKAQVDTGLNQVGQTVALGSADPRVIATRIINISLGFLAIILVSLFLYGGFLYMTSGGEADKAEKAKKILISAVIGTVIVLSSWAIARYVIEKLIGATSGEGGGVSQAGGGAGGGGLGGSGSSNAFQVKSISPQGAVPIRNVRVKLVFSRQVDEKTAAAIQVSQVSGNNLNGVAGTLAVSGSVVVFTPAADCPAPDDKLKCFEADANYQVTVGPGLKSTTGQAIVCGGFAPSCTTNFTTGKLIDTKEPSVEILEPLNGQSVPSDSLVTLRAKGEDESGISYLEFTDNGAPVDTVGPNAAETPKEFIGEAQWSTAGLALQSQHSLVATAYDIDAHKKDSEAVTVVVRPASCFNGVKDGQEAEIDCGGAVGSPTFCGACQGGACQGGNDCASGMCQNGICVQQPVIQYFTPTDGKVGTFVTLKGLNFGKKGKVIFLGAMNTPDDDKIALAPEVCSEQGIETWGISQVIVAVPVGAANGPLKIINDESLLSDSTNDGSGPKLADFIVNDVSYPGICAVQPAQGFVGEQFKVIGSGFDVNPDTLYFGAMPIKNVAVWKDNEVTANVPVVGTGKYSVQVRAGQLYSNPVSYLVQSKATAGPPQILSVSPEKGPKGEYVSLFGKNFGSSKGTVRFISKATGVEALGDTAFPAGCADSFWDDTNVIVKVPSVFVNKAEGVMPGEYEVKIIRSDAAESNKLPFAVTAGNAKPGICSISPSVGPVGTPVTMVGERFGVDAGAITFYKDVGGIAGPWTPSEVKTTVPAGSLTGPVSLAAQGQASNPINFQVRNCNEEANICKASEQCCPNGTCIPAKGVCGAQVLSSMYAWQSSTGLIPVSPQVVEECAPNNPQAPVPSPSPWDKRQGGDQVCVTASVMMRFTTHLDAATVTKDNIKLKKCTSNSSDPCASTEDVALSGGVPTVQPASIDQDLVELKPANDLEPSVTYLVQVSSGIKGEGPQGTFMEEKTSCGKGLAYCFRFKTRGDVKPCQVGSVSVTPHPYELHDAGTTKVTYLATPISVQDKCLVLNCDKYDWQWEHGADTRADFVKPLAMVAGKTLCKQKGYGISETGDVPVHMNATAKPDGVKGTADLYVRFIPPKVEDYGPKCDQACTNALIWARFTAEVVAASLAGNVEVRQCANENCYPSELGPALPISPNKIKLTVVPKSKEATARFLSIEPVQDAPGGPKTLLLPGKHYRVLLRGGMDAGIKGKNGVPLSGLNDPDGFTWTFRTKQGEDAFCAPNSVSVTPVEKYETLVGGRQLFHATIFGKPDQCSTDGQMLIQTESMSWTTSDNQVAEYFVGAKIDTGAALPARCGSNCLAMGAQAEFGKVAVCGNGVVETTDAKYCTGDPAVGMTTPWGDPCKLLPAGTDAGEECDSKLSALCEPTTCLWKPVAQVPAGTCGNGKLDKSEDCDMGRQCMGAPANSNTPDGSDCTPDAVKVLCEKNGGTCAPRQTRGCSPFCRNMGAKAATPKPSICGNGDIGDGEDCDDGNSSSFDGCSSDCLHTGSNATIASVCGNAILEPGETCEKGDPKAPFPPGCDQKTCLHLGAKLCDNDPKTPNVDCCGNGKADLGEDCDDGNKIASDGCGLSCLLEGSSSSYQSPSFCSDGVLETGEQCEAGLPSSHVKLQSQEFAKNSMPVPVIQGTGQGDGLVDDTQLAYIVGSANPDKDGKMTSSLTASLQKKQGQATYGLQCGYADEMSCGNANYGLTGAGCCDLRPKIQMSLPQGDDICLNTQIEVTFNVPMDVTVTAANVYLDKKVTTPGFDPQPCPPNLIKVSEDGKLIKAGWRSRLSYLWHRGAAWLTGKPAMALVMYCRGSATGQLIPVPSSGNKQFTFKLDSALEPKTTYRVKFLGDNSDPVNPLGDNSNPAKRLGIKSAKGVVAPYDHSDDAGPLTWSFTTGDKICTVNVVEARDLHKDHPLLFKENKEQHNFEAAAVSIQNGKSVLIQPVAQYAWTWQPWISSDEEIVKIIPSDKDNTQSVVEGQNKNGNAFVTASLKISEDKVSVPPTVGKNIQGTAPVMVMLCENIYPVFRDIKPAAGNGSSLVNTPFEAGPYFNFSTSYCRDSGVPGVDDDLPAMELSAVKETVNDKAEGILRQYLFAYGDDYKNLKKDGIGIRIMTNPMHYSLQDWYKWHNFMGQPKALTIDGYDAIQDGTTTYISAANTEAPGQGIYTNVYLISHNPDATPVTKNIYDQLVKNLAFNINLSKSVGNVCEKGNDPNNVVSAEIYYDAKTEKPVACSADFDCLKTSDDLHCGSYKLKLARDMRRISDFQKMAQSVEAYKNTSQTYPKLMSGTFLPGQSNSRWPSWDTELTSLATGSMPKDPVNQFLTCGRCSKSKAVCGTNADCDKDETCDGVQSGSTDPLTCWDSAKRQFFCPKVNLSPSRIYQYRSLNGGERYELNAEFEIPPPLAVPVQNKPYWWDPPLQTELKRCDTKDKSVGFLCTADKDCRPCANPKDDASCPLDKFPITVGSCKPVGGVFSYSDICKNQAYGESNICGDGVIGDAEVCELGETKVDDCSTADGQSGLKLQKCNECKSFVDDSKISQCDVGIKCGNGRVDKVCSEGNRAGKACMGDNDCPTVDPVKFASCVQTNEACDDGTLNGTYGHCNLTCTGYHSYCGDGQISPGEVCDAGSANGEYCGAGCNVNSSCGIACKDKAPYCGDGVTTSPEQCDGGVVTTDSALCVKGVNLSQPCTKDSDCDPDPALGRCWSEGMAPWAANCKHIKINRCATTLKQCVPENFTADASFKPADYKVCQADDDCAGMNPTSVCRPLREFVTSCKVGDDAPCSYPSIPGACVNYPTAHTRTCNPSGVANQCTYNAWTECKVLSFCGDGAIDGGEECDNGENNGDTNECTTLCKKNVCGDGKPHAGVEECDAGQNNGKITCSADYSSTCASCNKTCKFMSTAGGYCGDGIKNGPEQCDGNEAFTSKEETACTAMAVITKDPLGFLCKFKHATCLNPPCLRTKQGGVTCQSLGYDFSTSDLQPKMIVTDPFKIAELTSETPAAANCPALKDVKEYEYLMYKKCGVLSCYVGINPPPGACLTASSGQSYYKYAAEGGGDLTKDPEYMSGIGKYKCLMKLANQPTPKEFWECVKKEGPKYGIGVVSSNQQALPQCGLACGFTGCAKCSDEVGDGEIKGQIVDAVYNQVVAFAKVSLYYKGALVTQTSTDGDGKFTLTNLNKRSECSQYKLVVDKYDDNLCTNKSGRPGCGYPKFPGSWPYKDDIKEDKRGGYWPLTIEGFGVNDFAKRSHDGKGKFLMYPRPGAGEAYMTIVWDKPWDVYAATKVIPGGMANHLILPKEAAHTMPLYYAKCVGGSKVGNNCSKDAQCKTTVAANNKAACTAIGGIWDPNVADESQNDDILAGQNCFKGNGYCGAVLEENFTPKLCVYDDRPATDGRQCVRDVTWHQLLQGRGDLTILPYAQYFCAHSLGEKSDGYAPDSNLNGCPIEGRDACYEAKGATKPEEKLKYQAECDPYSLNDLDDDGNEILNECQLPKWNTCDFYANGPLTTYVRYAPFAGKSEPLKFFWNNWTAASGYFSLAEIKPMANLLKDKGYKAILSTDKSIIEVNAKDVNTPVGDMKYWHVADLDAATGVFVIKNTLINKSSRPEGMASYEFDFQGNWLEYPKGVAEYCQKDVNGVSVLRFFRNDDPAKVNACFGGNYVKLKQGNADDYKLWSRANY